METSGPVLDLGRLLRLRGMAESATRDVDIDSSAATGLAESYGRLRTEVGRFVGGTPVAEEFGSAFPPAPENVPPPSPSPGAMAARKAIAKHAASLLGQLAGWLDGLIQEQTLDQRLRLEAEERVKQERKQPPGFRGE